MNTFNTHAQQYMESKQYLMDELQRIISSVDNYISEHGLYNDIHRYVWDTPNWPIDESSVFEVSVGIDGATFHLTYVDQYDSLMDQYVNIYIPYHWADLRAAEIVKEIMEESVEEFEREECAGFIRDAEKMMKEVLG